MQPRQRRAPAPDCLNLQAWLSPTRAPGSDQPLLPVQCVCRARRLKRARRRLLHLEPGALGDLGVRNVVYLARSRIENAQLIARQVKATNQCAPPGPRRRLPLPARLVTGLLASSMGQGPTRRHTEVSTHSRHGARLTVGMEQRRLLHAAARALTRAVQATRGRRQPAARARRQQPGLEYAVFWLPRRTIACERVLQEEGVYGDVAAGELPIDFIPFDGDVLSLELDTAFRARALMWRCHAPPYRASAGLLQRSS